MSQVFNNNLRTAMGLCQQASDLAAKGISECNDESCSTLWSKLKADMDDCLGMIEKEIDGHKGKNKWD